MLRWIADEEPLPPAETALGPASEAPGLLAAGGRLTPGRLEEAYRSGIFPWYGPGQPVLWWSPDPRMVLRLEDFRLSQSLRKTLRRFLRTPGCALRFDHDFDAVIAACAGAPRPGQDGTWIVPAMRQAYRAWHRAGRVHSAETWVDGELVGGLYFVAIGCMVFGESMFARRTDASKLALAALVAACRARGIAWIDCQQNTGHLASLGAREVPRAAFLAHARAAAGGLDPRPWAGEARDWAWLPELGLPATPTDGGPDGAAGPPARVPSRARPESPHNTLHDAPLEPGLDATLAPAPDAAPGTPGDAATDSSPGQPPPARAAPD